MKRLDFQSEKLDELISAIGHICNQMEHLIEYDGNKKTWHGEGVLRQLRKLRSQLGCELMVELGVTGKAKPENMLPLTDLWCFIKHYATARIHLIELAEKQASDREIASYNQTIENLNELKLAFEEYVLFIYTQITKGKNGKGKCFKCRKDLEVDMKEMSLEAEAKKIERKN